MSIEDFADWISNHSADDRVWYIKRLAGNDTLANKSHQAGPYLPKSLLFSLFPDMKSIVDRNAKTWFEMTIDSHGMEPREVCATWYNNKLRDGTRDEARITSLGGIRSPLLDPDNTGGLAVFAFKISEGKECVCNTWVCCSVAEEELVEDKLGAIEPGKGRVWSENRQLQLLSGPVEAPAPKCWLGEGDVPAEWLIKFPSGAEIIARAIKIQKAGRLDADKRLLKRRDCEFELFRSVEQLVELPHIAKGFSSVDEFISRAQTILQRRKARSGRSLELHASVIFTEEKLVEYIDFEHQAHSEGAKRPDFLFPGTAAYRNSEFPEDNLRMLAVKTTCKDRWRQILNEADRIKTKHLLTLQEGVSINQFQEMKRAGVRLVVPKGLVDKYPKEVRPELMTLAQFISEVRSLSSSHTG